MFFEADPSEEARFVQFELEETFDELVVVRFEHFEADDELIRLRLSFEEPKKCLLSRRISVVVAYENDARFICSLDELRKCRARSFGGKRTPICCFVTKKIVGVSMDGAIDQRLVGAKELFLKPV